MATAKKEIYNQYEIDFLERKLKELEAYMEARPFDKLEDRMAYKETKGGGFIPTVVANIETQRKDLTQAIKDYAEISQTIAKMREMEDKKKIDARGGKEVSGIMAKMMGDQSK